MPTNIAFDQDTEKALRVELTRNVLKSIHKQAAELKPADPKEPPPNVPPVNMNPRRHDVVAWRHDGRGVDATRHETKEAALEHGRGLCFAVYYSWALMDGRDMVEKHAIHAPAGLEWLTLDSAEWPETLPLIMKGNDNADDSRC